MHRTSQYILCGQHNGNFDDAAKLLSEATQLEAGMTKHAMTPGEILPANELLGDLMLAQAKPDKALKAYKMSLSRTPNRFNSLYGAALAARELGREALAMEYFEQLIKVCSRADTDREELKYAKVFVADSS